MAVFEKNGKWFIDYYFRGRRVRESLRTKTAAEKALATRQGEILQGRYTWVDEKRAVSFETLAKEFEEFSLANKRSHRRD